MKLRLLLALLIFPLIAYAQEDNDNPNTIHLGFQADFMRPAYPSYLNGRQVHKHEGNVIYTHKTNGATITCDSAYHYYPSDTIEFFGNVVVTHQTTVLLSEKIFYDGIFAKVRGRLVKMYDSERNATLKTQFVDYNIDQNIGTYSQGGTLARARDTIESINGIFDGNTGVFTFINDVAMKNDSIILVCDTMLYDTHNDITTFIGNTKAWNGNNLILSDYGWYKPNENQISFSNNTYVQSATQEIWADSVCFDDKTKNAELFRDVQMIDTTQNIIIFGDKALINDNYETVIITENPAALYYTVAKTPEQLSDTTYLIADTICSLFQKVQIKKDCDTCKIIQIKDTATTQISVKDTVNKNIFEQDTISKNTNLNDTTLQNVIIQDTTIQNILQDTISKNTILNDTILQNIIIQDTATKNILQDTISKNILQDTTTQSIALPDTVSKNITIQDTATKNILQNTTSKNITRNVKLQNPSQMDSIPQSTQDTVSKNVIISDTTVRNVFAYHNVKIFKSDFQALCDSLIYHSVDSTTYMYHTPILWNDSTQITSGPSVFYSKNQQMDYAEFSSPAFVIMLEDSTHFSQLKGKLMKAFFKDNQLDKIHVLGNGQSVYYIREKADKPISAVEISECANIIISMILTDGKSKINKVSYLVKPASNTYPMDKIPEDSKQLKGFAWHDDIRPKSKTDLFNRQINQSQRQISQTFKKPAFEITSRINMIK